MKRFIAAVAVCSSLFVGAGCSQESTVTKKEEVKTPGGTTTVTTKTDVEKTGDHKDTNK
jgi:hypothetical protein